MKPIMNDIEERGSGTRLYGVAATVLYFLVFGLVLFFTQCSITSPPDERVTTGSIVIAFGESPTGMDDEKSQAVEPTPPPTPPTPPVKEVVPPTPVAEESVVEVPEPEEQVEEEIITPEREVNKRALFRVNKSETERPEQEANRGEGESEGVVGSERGSAESTESMLGGGISGDVNLAGRSLIGSLPKPDYGEQEEGRVVMIIVVDESGKVTSASVDPTRSTTNNSRLISAAQSAASKARFNPSESFVQSGTITYIFTLN